MKNVMSTGIEPETVLRWLPDDVQLYLKHTETGVSIRSLAREKGVHASTVMRQVRKTEARRDDPLVDSFLTRIGSDMRDRLPQVPFVDHAGEPEDDAVSPHMLRLLRALMKEGAFIAVGERVDTAVVLRAKPDGTPVTLAKGPTEIVELMALRGWVSGCKQGRIYRYHLAAEGRMALNRMLARAEGRATGLAEAPVDFSGFQSSPLAKTTRAARPRAGRRSVGAESPVRVLGRANGRKQPYLSPDLVAAAERLHRDFVLGQFEMAGVATWDRIQAAVKTVPGGTSPLDRKMDARRRFGNAIRALGPELGQICLAVCCHEKGMERIETDMSMPARSGKYMLRVALNYLVRHYQAASDTDHDLIY